MAGSANSIQTHNILRGKLSEDNVIAGTVGIGYNPTYALVGEAAAQIVLYINSSDYKMYAELKDKNGNHIMNSNIIDLPLETMVVNGNYDSETREVVLILDNGNELRFSVADLVRGLVSEEDLTTTLGDYVKFTDYATGNNSGIIKVDANNYGINTNAQGKLYVGEANYQQYETKGVNYFIGKGTLENVITGKQLVNKTYVDEADEVFEEDLFGDASIIDSGESIILNNTIEKAPLSITLKGNTYQETTTGKNLFNVTDYTNLPLSSNGSPTNSVIDKDKVTFTSNVNSGFSGVYIAKDNYSNIIDNYDETKSYYVTADIKTNINCDFRFVNQSSVSQITVGTQRLSFYGILPTIVFYVKNNNANIEISNIMIAETSETDYEPYTNGASPNPDYPQDIEVVTGNNTINICGKNLLNYENKTTNWQGASINTSDNLITYTPNSNGGGGMSHSSTTQYMRIPNGTKITFSQEYVSGNVWSSGALTNVLRLVRENGTYKDVNFGDITPNTYTTKKAITYTTTEDYVGFYTYAMMYTFNGGITPLVYQVQLEYGEVTTYEPYQSQSYPVNLGSIELCKIGTYQDRIYKSNGNWYLHKEVGKLSYSGNDYYSFTVNSVANDFVQFLTPAIDIIESLPSSVLCNYSVTGGSTASKKIRVNISHSVLGTTSSSTNSEARTAFINKMSGKTMVFYYPLETTTDTQITDTTLVNQLNALYNATSYDTQTNINQVNANLPFILDISTFKNTTKGKIEALEQEDENYEKLSNKVIELSSSSTDSEYPSAKCVYNLIGNIESILETLDIGNGV